MKKTKGTYWLSVVTRLTLSHFPGQAGKIIDAAVAEYVSNTEVRLEYLRQKGLYEQSLKDGEAKRKAHKDRHKTISEDHTIQGA